MVRSVIHRIFNIKRVNVSLKIVSLFSNVSYAYIFRTRMENNIYDYVRKSILWEDWW